jgi:hypothetical protein
VLTVYHAATSGLKERERREIGVGWSNQRHYIFREDRKMLLHWRFLGSAGFSLLERYV